MKKVFLYAMLAGLVACNTNHSQNGTVATQNLKKDMVSSAQFDSSFEKLLLDYFKLKDNFVARNDSMIGFYSRALLKDADTLNFTQLKADSTIIETASMNAQSIAAELQGLVEETTMENKQKSFYTTSEQLFELLKAVGYNKAVVYRLYCPMALQQSGAAWLSNSAAKKNPYLPTMQQCVQITDTIK
jgi:hypothetical protein